MATRSKTVRPRLSADERREQLIETAVTLFSEKGFNGVTTREIALAAGVTEAIIFRHFETKEQLCKAIIDRCMEGEEKAQWMAEIQQSMDRNDDEAVVRQLIQAIITIHKTDPKFERLMLYAALEGNRFALQHMQQITADIVTAFRNYFERRQRQGWQRGITADAALAAIVGMAQHYGRDRYIYGLKGKCLSDEEALDSFTEIALNGLRGSKAGRKR